MLLVTLEVSQHRYPHSSSSSSPMSRAASAASRSAFFIEPSRATCTVLSTVFAPRHLFSAEVGLVLLGEQVLSPIWVFAGVGEAPSRWTIAGGALLLSVLALHEAAALREERREARRGDAPGAGSSSSTTAVEIVKA